MASKMRPVFTEGSNTKALRGLMIGLAALVVLAVSAYGTVIYIQLMGKVFLLGRCSWRAIWGRVCQRGLDAGVAGREVRVVPSRRSRGGKLDCDGCGTAGGYPQYDVSL